MTPTETALVYDSPKLGPVPYGPDDVLTFDDGLPGFEGLREFLAVTREECVPFLFLAALADPAVTLPLLPLPLVAGAGAEAMLAEAAQAVASTTAETVAAYAVVGIGPGARELVVNLRAPVVINLDTRRGAQVILADDCLPVAARVEG